MSEREEFEHDWEEEANAVIEDIKQHVDKISIATLPSSKKRIYFNITTLEKKDFCVELSEEGFRIVGEIYNSDEKKGKYSAFETPYSLLDSLSPAYRDSFSEELFNKLNSLQKKLEGDSKEGSDNGDNPRND